MGLRGNRTAVEICVLCTNFFGALSGGVLGLTVPLIAHDFGVDIELAAWTTLSSMFASAMLGPALGKIADGFGRRRMFWTMYLLQLLSYFTCWQAPTFGWLVFGRTLGGISWAGTQKPSLPRDQTQRLTLLIVCAGAGCLRGAGTSPAGFGIMTRGLDPQRRGRIVALQSATGSLGGSIGYAVGGLVVQYTSWRTLFSAPLPILSCIWLASLALLPPDDAVTTPRTSSPSSRNAPGGATNGKPVRCWRSSLSPHSYAHTCSEGS